MGRSSKSRNKSSSLRKNTFRQIGNIYRTECQDLAKSIRNARNLVSNFWKKDELSSSVIETKVTNDFDSMLFEQMKEYRAHYEYERRAQEDDRKQRMREEYDRIMKEEREKFTRLTELPESRKLNMTVNCSEDVIAVTDLILDSDESTIVIINDKLMLETWIDANSPAFDRHAQCNLSLISNGKKLGEFRFNLSNMIRVKMSLLAEIEAHL